MVQIYFQCVFLQELNKVSVQLDQLTAKFQEKQEHCIQLESHLKDHKEKHLSLEQKVEDLEGHIKVCVKPVGFVVFSTQQLWGLMAFTDSKTVK